MDVAVVAGEGKSNVLIVDATVTDANVEVVVEVVAVALVVKWLATKHPGKILSPANCLCNVADHQYRRRAIPVTRPRVVKGPSVNCQLPPLNLSVDTKESADLQAAREFHASLGSSSKQSKFQGKARDGSIDRQSQSSRSLIEEKSVKPLARPPRQGYIVLNKNRRPSLTFDSPQLSSPETFMERVRTNILRTSQQPSQQRITATAPSSTATVVPSAGTVAPKITSSLPTTTQQTTSGNAAVTSPNKVGNSLPSRAIQNAAGNLPVENANSAEAREQLVPDVSRPQPPQQRSIAGLDPMVHIQALEASGVLDKEMIDKLKNAIRTSIDAQATTKPISGSRPRETVPNDAKDLHEPSRPAIYTQAELEALRPDTESKSPSKASVPAPRKSATTHQADKPTDSFTARSIPLQPSGPANNSRSLAQRLADQRKALIGEHIHRTRFQPPLQFLIEGFKKLSLRDYTNTELATGVTSPKATKNPFGSPTINMATPEMPSHLHDLARAQYEFEEPLGAPKPRGSEPELPRHLRNLIPTTDHGAAVRRQYGIPDIAAPESKTQNNPMLAPKAGETSPQPPRRSRVAANTSPTARPAAFAKPRPSLPPHLRGKIAGDAGAAARSQYGGEVPASSTNNQVTSSIRSKEDRPATSKSQLSAHLREQTAGDPGAAVRAQYGNVLAPVTNSLKPSTTAKKGESSSPTKPRRGSKVNSSGFIGLAQAARNSVRDEEEEEDPIRIASSRGF